MTTHHCPAFSCTDCRNPCCVLYTLAPHLTGLESTSCCFASLSIPDRPRPSPCYKPVLVSLGRAAAPSPVTCTYTA